ncbi:hypothetical protein GGR56DRAFT_636094 [Xylariaceae sp. FL0804]|nr:hypothetical protein GGR56DRAFT_636094 [Xylariaceae sp. FL0804]
MASIFSNIWNQTPSRGASATDQEQRGMKRKPKLDPYDDLGDDESPQKPPASQRAKKSARTSSGSTASGSKTRPAALETYSRRRTSIRRSRDFAQLDSADENPPLVPVADMGAPVADMGASEHLDGTLQSAAKTKAKSAKESAGSGTQRAAEPAPVEAGEEEEEEEAEEVEEEEEEEEEDEEEEEEKEVVEDRNEDEDEGEKVIDDDDREEHEVSKLLKHRMAKDGSGAVELLVEWARERPEDATWELEEEIQQGAEETLLAYWKAQGGRTKALFISPKNPPPQTYHVFDILSHEKKARGGFQFEVQWVGYRPVHGETTIETESKLRRAAPDLLNQYWDTIGGRKAHLGRRGRARKPEKLLE